MRGTRGDKYHEFTDSAFCDGANEVHMRLEKRKWVLREGSHLTILRRLLLLVRRPPVPWVDGAGRQPFALILYLDRPLTLIARAGEARAQRRAAHRRRSDPPAGPIRHRQDGVQARRLAWAGQRLRVAPIAVQAVQAVVAGHVMERRLVGVRRGQTVVAVRVARVRPARRIRVCVYLGVGRRRIRHI